MYKQQVVLCRKKRGVNNVFAVFDLQLDQRSMLMALIEQNAIQGTIDRIVPEYSHYSEACPALNQAMPSFHFVAFSGKWTTEHSIATDFEQMIITLRDALATWQQLRSQFGNTSRDAALIEVSRAFSAVSSDIDPVDTFADEKVRMNQPLPREVPDVIPYRWE